MPAVEISEIVPGLVARLDTAALRATGGSLTNAQRNDTDDRAVTDVHDFLVLAVDARSGLCTAVPLYPKTAPGSSPLDPRKRRGDVESWLSEPAFFSRWQHWRIPLAAFASASAGDPASTGARRSFAAGDADTLQDISNWAFRNRCEFRPV